MLIRFSQLPLEQQNILRSISNYVEVSQELKERKDQDTGSFRKNLEEYFEEKLTKGSLFYKRYKRKNATHYHVELSNPDTKHLEIIKVIIKYNNEHYASHTFEGLNFI